MMILNNLHKWFIRNEERCIDSAILIVGVIWTGVIIWALENWLAGGAK